MIQPETFYLRDPRFSIVSRGRTSWVSKPEGERRHHVGTYDDAALAAILPYVTVPIAGKDLRMRLAQRPDVLAIVPKLVHDGLILAGTNDALMERCKIGTSAAPNRVGTMVLGITGGIYASLLMPFLYQLPSTLCDRLEVVLTEGANFEGSLEDLRAARAACGLPILRKDFVVDPYQLYEARVAGADAVLLIVAALDQEELASLHELATRLGLDALVEVHDRDELERAARVGARLIGVNNRDLRDFTVDVGRTRQLLDGMPAGAIVVSESGIGAPEQLRALERYGVSAVLVGESLMRAPDPQGALAALLVGTQAEV